MSELVEALQDLDVPPAEGVDTAFKRWYPELKELARARLRGLTSRGGTQTTALVHDAYLRLADQDELRFGTRLQFLAYASRTMRHLLIDDIRAERAQRRGGGADLLTLDTALAEGLSPDLDVEQINEALESLEQIDKSKARLVEMRFFGGLTALEIAEATGSSERSVQREWSKARGLLLTLLS